jgi:electron transfer flavoprotein beta subunit
LNIPSINVVTKIDYNGGNFTFDRDIDGGKETLTCAGPLVASAQKDLCEPRIPNMRGIMAARTKPLKVVDPIATNAHTSIKEFSLPPAKTGVKLIAPDQMDELVKLLKEEAKVI